MDWIKALDTYFKAKDIYDKLNDVKKLHDYGTKLKPGKLEWDDIKFFSNAELDKAIKAAKANEAALDAALSVGWEMPESQTIGLFLTWMAAASKKGEDSPAAKSAAAAYLKGLIKQQIQFVSMLDDAKTAQKDLPEKIKLAKAMTDYADVVQKALEKLVSVPNPMVPGTAWQAEMFSLSVDVGSFRGVMGSIHDKLGKLKDVNAKAISDLTAVVDNNKSWIAWADASANRSPEDLKKNQKATKPKN